MRMRFAHVYYLHRDAIVGVLHVGSYVRNPEAELRLRHGSSTPVLCITPCFAYLCQSNLKEACFTIGLMQA